MQPMPTFAPHTPPTSASAWIEQWAHLVGAGGAVLDVASGNGRHARYFASRGHAVLALDRDAAALANLDGVAHVTTRQADLEDASWPLAAHEKFAAVVVTNYLHRPLFPYFVDALAPGGVLLYETFAAGNERYGRPSNPAFLLNPGELLELAKGTNGASGPLRVIAYQDGFISVRRASCVQRICAVREPAFAQSGITERNNVVGPDRYVLPG